GVTPLSTTGRPSTGRSRDHGSAGRCGHANDDRCRGPGPRLDTGVRPPRAAPAADRDAAAGTVPRPPAGGGFGGSAPARGDERRAGRGRGGALRQGRGGSLRRGGEGAIRRGQEREIGRSWQGEVRRARDGGSGRRRDGEDRRGRGGGGGPEAGGETPGG